MVGRGASVGAVAGSGGSLFLRKSLVAAQVALSVANFTAAILDVVMPQVEGTEIVRYMKSEKRPAPDSLLFN